MNEQDKKYIKPYIDFFSYVCANDQHIEQICCAVQIGSYTNQYRVNLIKSFEYETISKFLNDYDKPINWKEVVNICLGKQRGDILRHIVDNSVKDQRITLQEVVRVNYFVKLYNKNSLC